MGEESEQVTIFSFLEDDIRSWVEEYIKETDVVSTGETTHPIDVLFAIIAHFYPPLKNETIRRSTDKNRIRSKLKKIRNFFNAYNIPAPEHWLLFVENDETDKEFLQNINLVFVSFQNHILKKELTELTNQQLAVLQEMLNIQEGNRFYRNKLQTILNYVQKNPELPFSSEIIQFITTEPECFKSE
ncbi:hypothetical protein TRFO_19274 [Tritrichomonas foetus]|uniref:Uncharacterized protein n=1 Tax=Tritrichomonas foetus TaxID=1144522 RepID=A0A1J4KIX3_9EUKA|nr:hypothetical protein TRFO_19274 [Tritrichomonas foetus]|eukprot:OHT11297.1 hypothetical protein TRFO_19274 [Tritrichomonas foetus]